MPPFQISDAAQRSSLICARHLEVLCGANSSRCSTPQFFPMGFLKDMNPTSALSALQNVQEQLYVSRLAVAGMIIKY